MMQNKLREFQKLEISNSTALTNTKKTRSESWKIYAKMFEFFFVSSRFDEATKQNGFEGRLKWTHSNSIASFNITANNIRRNKIEL